MNEMHSPKKNFGKKNEGGACIMGGYNHPLQALIKKYGFS
jgi:hypothetical protein